MLFMNPKEELSVINGRYILKSDPAGAIKIFTDLLEKFERLSIKYPTVHLYKSRAEAELLLGDRVNAEKDLKRAIREFESNRESIAVAAQRIDFFKKRNRYTMR